jgi:formylglycine-generating enzyme
MLAPALIAALGLAAACQRKQTPSEPAPSASDEPAAPPGVDAALDATSAPAQVEADAAAAAAFPPARTDGCPDGMVRVEGQYCPGVMQDCIEHHPEYAARKHDPTVSERCLKYREPSRCISKQRRTLSFCIDRYEYPNQTGELPRILTSWREAKLLCEREQKRLCTEDEFNFACEGPEMLPHVYGFTRDPTKCNIDKPYVQPDHSRQMLGYDTCLKTEWCAAEVQRLDKRHPIGSTHSCVSWSGVVDMNGNVNEWVELPGKKPPNRSGLKGGWWGPVRNRCRPTVTFHKEGDYGYEAGFRCCKDATGTSGAAAPDGGGP